MKGKFLVTISGTDQKSEILSSTYFISEYDENIKKALISIYQEEWEYYSPINIGITMYNIEELCKSFKADKHIEALIDIRLHEEKLADLEKEADEIDLLRKLQKKYPSIKGD